MVTIIGTPNMLVCGMTRKGYSMERKPLFRFDQNGEYKTEDKKLIERAAKRFEIKKEEKKAEVLKVEEQKTESVKTEEAKTKPLRTCKICGEEFDSVGLFMAHMRVHKSKGES